MTIYGNYKVMLAHTNEDTTRSKMLLQLHFQHMNKETSKVTMDITPRPSNMAHVEEHHTLHTLKFHKIYNKRGDGKYINAKVCFINTAATVWISAHPILGNKNHTEHNQISSRNFDVRNLPYKRFKSFHHLSPSSMIRNV